MEQLRHDRADAAEMSRARSPAERVRERSLLDRDGKISGVQFLGARSKQDIDAGLPAKLIIIRFRSRISFVISAGSELQRVHENADGDLPVFSSRPARDPNQLAVAAMQGPHRRNKDPVTVASPAVTRRGDCSPDFHRSYSSQIACRANANRAWPKFFQPARSASDRNSSKENARSAERRASI